MLPTDQLLQDAPATAQTSLTAFGTVFTTVTWALLIAINFWCLRKLFRNPGGPQASPESPAMPDEIVAPATIEAVPRPTEASPAPVQAALASPAAASPAAAGHATAGHAAAGPAPTQGDPAPVAAAR